MSLVLGEYDDDYVLLDHRHTGGSGSVHQDWDGRLGPGYPLSEAEGRVVRRAVWVVWTVSVAILAALGAASIMGG